MSLEFANEHSDVQFEKYLSPGACFARLLPMAVPRRRSMNPNALKKLKKLSDRLDIAKDTSEATTKKVQLARQTAKKIERDVRLQQHPDHTKGKRKRSKDRYTEDGKSKAAVELGRKGGTARAKTLTRHQRSALATKAAKTRWNRH